VSDVTAGPVIVTGAQQGIGLVIARTFAEAGRDVVIADINILADGEALRKSWACQGEVSTLVCDITDAESIELMLDQVEAEFGQAADTLVNNAATQVWGPFIEADIDDLQRVINTNLVGTMLMTQRFARRRISAGGGGVVVNLGSACNTIAFPQLASYVASKGGIETFTKSAALELGAYGIRVNCIAPGAIETERTRAETEGYAERWSVLTPLGRVGTPEDVAKTTLALCSDALEFVSGQTVGVDGGLFSRSVWPADY